jgi:pSer/pThr/pTyr-binding forkhead associated (FHA) protein
MSVTPPLGDSIAVDEALLVLKVLFLVLLYLFIWRIVRSASRDVRLPQESFILRPGDAEAAAASGLATSQPVQTTGRLVVVKSPALEEGTTFELDSAALTIGRGGQNDVPLENDEFASARHARFEPRRDGVWVQDRGSTNGTFVNDAQLERPRRLAPGDIVRVGETDLRYDR